MMSTKSDIVWETDLRLFSREMLLSWTKVMIITLGVMALILGMAMVPSEGWKAILNILPMLATLVAGLWALGLLVMALVFRGRYRVRYTVSDQGIRLETLSTVAKKANRLAIVLGALSGKPGLAGAGLISTTQETQEVKWKGRFHMAQSPSRQTIALKGPWRNLMLVQCTAENYAQVAARITAELDKHRTAGRAPAQSPLPGYLLRSLLVVLTSLPCFILADEYHLDALLPLLMFCFALATVWFIPLFGWVVLGTLGLQAVRLAAALLESRTSMFRPGETYLRYTVLSGDDWALIALAGAGMAWLAWFSLGAIRGRIPSALTADFGDMEGD